MAFRVRHAIPLSLLAGVSMWPMTAGALSCEYDAPRPSRTRVPAVVFDGIDPDTERSRSGEWARR